jgi:hypothetical protein
LCSSVSATAGLAYSSRHAGNPYHEKIILSNSGTPTQPIVINGIAGPEGQLPVLDASNGDARQHLVGVG